MFSSLKMRLLLALYIFLIIAIPVGTYLISQQKNIKSSASEGHPSPPPIVSTVNPTPAPSTPTASALAKQLLGSSASNPTPSSSGSPEPSSPTIAQSFGPTLSLKVTIQGRPATNQATKLFVGIIEGAVSSNPKFLLNFSVDLPTDGSYSNLSLAGLTVGNQYTALLKGSSTIATAVSFTMSPNVSSLNNGQPVSLTSGDLNDDNAITDADYNIVKAALGSSSGSTNWNGSADLNADGVVNVFDLAIVQGNIGKTGDSGVWTSPVPRTATSSASLSGNKAVGGMSDSVDRGYWLWMPK